jgi:DNA-binding Lrp family transcriptional regulator
MPSQSDTLLDLLQENARLTDAELADRLGLSEEEVKQRIAGYHERGEVLGYQAVVDREKVAVGQVNALIEVKVTPERGGGFDRLAERVARFEQVRHCYLMSGSYDLVVFVSGESLQDIARFVSEKLSTLEGVLSTATHFMLKTYKEGGFLAGGTSEPVRLAVTP